MKCEVKSRVNRLAVLIDADNVKAKLIEPLLKEIAKYGTANVKRIYGDWTSPQLTCWKEKLNQFAIQPIQQFSYTAGKNSTDSALIIDAMDLLYTQNFEGFCIISSDSDFTRLACRIREEGLFVYGFGENKTPESFVRACDKFIYTEILEELEDQAEDNFLEIPSIKNNHFNESPLTQSTDDEPHYQLRNNKNLVNLLKDAYEASTDEDGWINLGSLGTQLNKLSPSFDSRNFGYKKLGELVQAINMFDIKEIRHKTTPEVKHVYVKLKS